MFTLRLYVSRDLTVTPCAECVFLFAFLCVQLRPRTILHGLLFLSSVVSKLLSDWPIDCFLRYLCLFIVVMTSYQLC